MNINGYFIAWFVAHNQPVTIENMFNPDEKSMLPIFSTTEKLAMALTWIRPRFGETEIVEITNGIKFLKAVGDKLTVIIDPYQDDGKLKRKTSR
jgi:hypothetical protein